jgi:hypothetical protein
VWFSALVATEFVEEHVRRKTMAMVTILSSILELFAAVSSAAAIVASAVDLNEHYCYWDSLHQELLMRVHKKEDNNGHHKLHHELSL